MKRSQDKGIKVSETNKETTKVNATTIDTIAEKEKEGKKSKFDDCYEEMLSSCYTCKEYGLDEEVSSHI